MDPVTGAIVVSVASSLASAGLGWLIAHLSHRTSNAHVQAVIAQTGQVATQAASAGAAAAVQAMATGAKPQDAARAAGAAAVSVGVQALPRVVSTAPMGPAT